MKMKLTRKTSIIGITLGVKDATYYQIDGVVDHESGIVERADQRANETALILGRLIEELHTARVLSDDAVLRILTEFKKAE